ncbi:phosphatase PAP2 family protein [uncultured Limosilactobacillus sp.]|uniref:phosphatase PAP2 family protein n=1 Tax=uncultured Limosilactobacillus sp. TaxID=2837629 RepID=UPI0026012D8D|nr:phosphatase PAP2 family protein [uncultured Limosilactobacillus sp.]
MVASIQPQFNLTWLTFFIITATGFGILCWLVQSSPRFNLVEQQIQERLIHQQNHWWWRSIAVVFDPKTIVGWDFLLAAYLLVHGRVERAVYVLAMLATVDAFGILIKHMIKRQRPITFNQLTQTYSFPSGHTLGTTMMALMMSQLFSQPVMISLVWIAWGLVIICRLTLRAHYPADVGGAVLLAVSWWIGGDLIYLLIMR